MIKKLLKKIKTFLRKDHLYEHEINKLMLGKILSNQIKTIKDVNVEFKNLEFRVFSQFGDDGIIQWLVDSLNITNKIFVEFGVEDYRESNTRFLMMNNNWSGFVMDGCIENINRLKSQYYYWQYDLSAQAVFITKDNINLLIESKNLPKDIGILCIDLDGNDYYIWKALNVILPIIVIIEYNSLFGIDRPISIIYDDKFVRNNAHCSNLFWGASLLSFNILAKEKGYSFVGCNSAGNNAFFVRNDKLNPKVRATSLVNGFIESNYRESRDKAGQLSYLSKQESKKLLSGIKVFNTELNCEEFF